MGCACQRASPSIVADLDSNATRIPRHGDRAVARPTVPDDIRHALAHGPGERGLDARRQRSQLAGSGAGDSSSCEDLSGGAQLALEGWLAVAGDRLAHLM